MPISHSEIGLICTNLANELGHHPVDTRSLTSADDVGLPALGPSELSELERCG